MPTKKLEFKNFKLLDKKSSDVDLAPDIARIMKNFSTTNRPGSLVKKFPYADITDTLVDTFPSGYTIKNIYEWVVGKPSTKKIYLVHAEDGSSNEVLLMGPNYIGKYSDTVYTAGSFSDTWVNLFETETVTSESGTAAGQIVASGLSSSVDDYYNNWIAQVSSIGAWAIIFDYVGSTNTLESVTDAFTGITAVGTSVKIGRTRLAFTSMTVDDVIRKLLRFDAIVLLTGSSTYFPVQYNPWIGHKEITYGANGFPILDHFDVDVDKFIEPGFNSSTDSIITMAVLTGVGSLDVGEWRCKIAFQYDGFQVGPLSDDYVNASTSGSDLGLDINYYLPITANYSSGLSDFVDPWDNNQPSGYPELLSHRISGLYIFLKGPNDSDYQLVETHKVTQFVDGPNISVFTYDIDVTGKPQFDESGASGLSTGSTANILTNPSGGQTYSQLAGGVNVFSNYKFAVNLDGTILAANIKNQDSQYGGDKLIGSLSPQNDFFIASQAVNLGFYGSQSITGLAIIGDSPQTTSPKARAYVFTEDAYYILKISTSTFGFETDKIGQREGLYATESLVFAEGHLFGVSRNGFRLYTVQGTRIIGETLKDDFDALTDPSDCIASYHRTARQVLFHFPTDSKTYFIDMLREDFPMFEVEWNDDFTAFEQLSDGSLISVNSSKIFNHDSGNNQDGATIVPQVKTIVINASHLGGEIGDIIHLINGFTQYKSNTAITVNFYLDRSGSSLSMPNISHPAKTTLGQNDFQFPIGSNCKEFEVEVLLDATQKLTNTELILENFGVDFQITKNIKRF